MMAPITASLDIAQPINHDLQSDSPWVHPASKLAPASKPGETVVDLLMHPRGPIMRCFNNWLGGPLRYDRLGLVQAVPAAMRTQGYDGLQQPSSIRRYANGLRIDVAHGARDPRFIHSGLDGAPRMVNGTLQGVASPEQEGGLEIGRPFDVGHCYFHPVVSPTLNGRQNGPDVWRIESTLAPNLVNSPVACLSLAIAHEYFFSTFLQKLSVSSIPLSLPVGERPRFTHSSSVDPTPAQGPMAEFKMMESVIFWRVVRNLVDSLPPEQSERFLSRPLVNVLRNTPGDISVGESLVSGWINWPCRMLVDIQHDMSSDRTMQWVGSIDLVAARLAELQHAVLRCEVAAAARGAIGRQYVIGQLRDTVCQALGLQSPAEQAQFELLCKFKRQQGYAALVSFDTGYDVQYLVNLSRNATTPAQKTNVAIMGKLIQFISERPNDGRDLQFKFDSLD